MKHGTWRREREALARGLACETYELALKIVGVTMAAEAPFYVAEGALELVHQMLNRADVKDVILETYEQLSDMEGSVSDVRA